MADHRGHPTQRSEGEWVVECACGWLSDPAPTEKAAVDTMRQHRSQMFTCTVCGQHVSLRKNAWDRRERKDGGLDHEHCHGGPTRKERSSMRREETEAMNAQELRERREHRRAVREFELRGDDRYGPLRHG